MHNASRMKFVVATMTKDYEKARDIANKILEDEPDNTILQNYLSTFDKERIIKTMKKRIHEDTDSAESEVESSTESNSDSNDDSDKGSGQSSADDDNERTVIEAKTFSRRFVKVKTSYDSSNRHNTKDNLDKLRHNDFRGKMIRVLPIRLSDKITGAK